MIMIKSMAELNKLILQIKTNIQELSEQISTAEDQGRCDSVAVAQRRQLQESLKNLEQMLQTWMRG